MFVKKYYTTFINIYMFIHIIDSFCFCFEISKIFKVLKNTNTTEYQTTDTHNKYHNNIKKKKQSHASI